MTEKSENEKSARAKVFMVAAQLMVAILMILLAIFLYGGLSAGWFAENKEVTATGMSVKVQGLRLGEPKIAEINVFRPRLNDQKPTTPIYTVTPGENWTDADWEKDNNMLLPGDRIQVKATFTVLPPEQQLVKPGEEPAPQKTAVPAEFFISAPQDPVDGSGGVTRKTENPVVITTGGKDAYYYLSSQIWLKEASYQKEGSKQSVVLWNEAGGKKQTMLSTHTLGAGTALALPVPDIRLGTKETPEMLEEGTYTVTLELEFVNDPNVNQTPLRGDITKDPVVPSSFWRELVINEVLS